MSIFFDSAKQSGVCLPSGLQQWPSGQGDFKPITQVTPEKVYDYHSKLDYVYRIHIELGKLNNSEIIINKVRPQERRLKFSNVMLFLQAQLQEVYQQELCVILLKIAEEIQQLRHQNIQPLKEYIEQNTKQIKPKRNRKTNGITKSMKQIIISNTEQANANIIVEQLQQIISNQ